MKPARRIRPLAIVLLTASSLLGQETTPSADALVDAVRDRPVSEAWSSLAALRDLAASAPKRAPELSSAARSLSTIVSAPGPIDRRCLAALCIGSLGTHAKDAASTLAVALATEAKPTELQLGAAIALTRLGEPAAKPLGEVLALRASKATTYLKGKKIKGKQLANGDQLAAILAIFAVAELGEDAKSQSKRLLKHVANLPNFDSFLIHQHCARALSAMGKSKSSRKAIEQREEFERRARGRGGLVPGKKQMFVGLMQQELGVSFEGCSMPKDMPNLEKHSKLGSAVMDLYDHLVAELIRTSADLWTDPEFDHSVWRERTAGLVELAKVLQVLGAGKR